ncbi:MAG: two-component system response regulator [Deltaproteobacteria bacterium RBG_13_61_14]|nr:MAG: two-component system response regulator [Deltaproteobacteria bacterium RBG_13_61_14]
MPDLKILVVEDSPTMRQLIFFALKRMKGIEIVEAADGVEGLKKLNSQSFDLIITDINMPVMDGLKLISLVRRDVKYRTIPIMIITTEGGAEDRERALALGADAYITKPIQAGNVLDTAKSLLGIP